MKQVKKNTTSKLAIHEKDVGSTQVQIELLSKKRSSYSNNSLIKLNNSLKLDTLIITSSQQSKLIDKKINSKNFKEFARIYFKKIFCRN